MAVRRRAGAESERWRLGAGALGAALIAVASLPGLAQAPPSVTAGAARAAGVLADDALDPTLDGQRGRLRGVEDSLTSSEAERRRIEAAIEAIRTDRIRLSAALIAETGRVRDTETALAKLEARLDVLRGSEEVIKRSLESRKALIAEVLGALQRIGRKPLPAILVRPDDMLLAIRTSMLLGAVVPELRDQTEQLAADLTELTQVRAQIIGDRDIISQQASALVLERERLAALVDARQAAQGEAEGSLETERRRLADLAREASSLKDLIARMEGTGAAARSAAEARQRDAEAEAEDIRAKANAGDLKESAQLAPALAFSDARGLLPLPAGGSVIKSYGDADGFGGVEHGVSIATRAEAVVSAPADGRVSFSGPYRSYGQLLILNTGGGYYVVLAGLDRISVVPGQFVLAGEAVGTMGDRSSRTAATVALGAAQPVLYVEFRKDGAAIDPGPWWAKSEFEKARG